MFKNSRIYPKLKVKISRNLKFPANQLPYICRKIVQKKPDTNRVNVTTLTTTNLTTNDHYDLKEVPGFQRTVSTIP